MNCIIDVYSSITAYILLYQFFRDDIVQGNSGKHLTMIPPLGYMKDPEDKNKWIVNEEDALIVKEIFNLCVKDYGPSQIARILTERVIETPSLYLHRKKLPCSVKIKQNAEVWDYSILVGILENEEYRGGFVLYPLPVMGAISTVIMIALLVYIYFAFLRKKKQTCEKTAENPPENANKNE